ncbi:MAG: integrase core domain-containing protein [Thermoplasmata archaeon]|nr:integrase core domain-containing protein [Thermoplasmata archaeon]
MGVELRMTRKHRPEDNGVKESFHGHLKMDYRWVREPESFLASRRRLAESIDDYNTERPPSPLRYLTSNEFARKELEEIEA